MVPVMKQILVKLAFGCLTLAVVSLILTMLGFPWLAALLAAISSLSFCLFVWASIWKRNIILTLLFALLSVTAFIAHLWAWKPHLHLIAS